MVLVSCRDGESLVEVPSCQVRTNVNAQDAMH